MPHICDMLIQYKFNTTSPRISINLAGAIVSLTIHPHKRLGISLTVLAVNMHPPRKLPKTYT